ncbi:MAG: type II toxin-antitoxin system RelE/ParE family toxin [Verrucomicrobiota bacterium]
MRKVILESGARLDIRSICQFYDERSQTAGDRFIDELEALVESILGAPERYPCVGKQSKYRKANLKVFPYQVVYRVTPSQIRIVIVKHDKRHPEVGTDRLEE